MNKILYKALFVAFLWSANSMADTNVLTINTKIVGGEIATEGDWPWMSALVYTYQGVTTSLTVDSVNYESQSFTYGPEGNVSGELIDCGIGDNTCSDATDNVCLIERGDINFSVKADNCEAGGGVGVIIYNNVDGTISGTLGEDFAGAIPVVAVTQADGEFLQTKLGINASIVVVNNSLAQDSTCGASFLGGKWVLTASHCVEGEQAANIKINVGEYDLSNGAENAIAVKRIYMHPDYDSVSIDNDVALLELVQSVDNEAITLVSPETTQQSAIDNSTVTVMGWGGRVGYEPNGGPTSDFPDVLHQVDLQLMTNAQCLNLLGGGYDLSTSMICAAFEGGGKGSCQGDSGGPLVINTNEGWQQIGIVSWGVGCAAEGYPGVYARTSIFIDWINAIMSGLAIEPNHDFGISPQNIAQSHQLTLDNNSLIDANLTFSIEGDQEFIAVGDDCLQLAAASTCQLTVNYSAEQVGTHSATLVITSDNEQLAVSYSKISGQTIAVAQDLATHLATDSSVLQWYTGGDFSWQGTSGSNDIQSGNITDNQESIVMLTLEGEGDIAFEWAVSSEENTEEAESPFDALYLYIDDELITFISGEVDFTQETFALTAGAHKVTWVYRKDPAASELKDKGYLRNVTFTVVADPIVTTPIVTTPDVVLPEIKNTESSSGGGIGYLSMFLLVLINLGRRMNALCK